MLMHTLAAVQAQPTVQLSRALLIECDSAKQRQIIEQLRALGVAGYPVRTATVYSVERKTRTAVISCVADERYLPLIRALDGVFSVAVGPPHKP